MNLSIWFLRKNYERSLEAKSFRKWVENFADELEAGLYEYSEEYRVSKKI